MVIPASVKSRKAPGLIGTLACFDNAMQNVLLKQPAHRQGYIITLCYSAEMPARQQTRQIRAAYGDRLSERAGEEESLQLKPVGHRQMF